MLRLAIVSPCYNEEEVLPTSANTLGQLLDRLVLEGRIASDSFVLFVNDEKLMHFAYQRYLENQFRKSFGFEGTPIRFILRNKNQKGDDVK